MIGNTFTQTELLSLEKCRDYTENHGVEYCTFLKNSQILFSKAGDRDVVKFNEDELSIILKTKPDMLVHSHPGNSSLSLCDLRFAYKYNIKIAAITPLGDIYWASGGTAGTAISEFGHNIGRELQKLPESMSDSFLKTIVERNWYHMLWIYTKMELGLDYNYQICSNTEKEISVVSPIFYKYRKCMY